MPENASQKRKSYYRIGFDCGVAGESFNNDDGTSRQLLLSRVEPGMPVDLIKEPENPRDPEAIKVVVRGIGQVGYLKSWFAERVHEHESFGGRIQAKVAEVSGGTKRKPIYGITLAIQPLDRQGNAMNNLLQDSLSSPDAGKAAPSSQPQKLTESAPERSAAQTPPEESKLWILWAIIAGAVLFLYALSLV